MIPLPPTRLQLNTDDILEYEAAKKNWQRFLKEDGKRPVVDEKGMKKKEVQDRIGYVAKK